MRNRAWSVIIKPSTLKGSIYLGVLETIIPIIFAESRTNLFLRHEIRKYCSLSFVDRRNLLFLYKESSSNDE